MFRSLVPVLCLTMALSTVDAPDASAASDPWQLNLFVPRGDASKAMDRLRSLDPDSISPRDALALIYELRDLVREG